MYLLEGSLCLLILEFQKIFVDADISTELFLLNYTVLCFEIKLCLSDDNCVCKIKKQWKN